MPHRNLLPSLVPALAIRIALLGTAAGGAHAFDRVNVLVTHVPVGAPPAQGVAGSPRYTRLGSAGPFGIAALGDSLLFLDAPRHRVLRLREGKVTVFAGNGEHGSRIDPDSALRTELGRPLALLVLRDRSVLIAHSMLTPQRPFAGVVVLRIRTRPNPGEPTVSLYAGNGARRAAIVPGSALDTPIYGARAMAQARDGAVLIADAVGQQVLRVQPDGMVQVFAGTGVRGNHLDPASGPGTQLNLPTGLAVLEDGSVLIADSANHRVLRVQNGAVTVFAGAVPGAEHPVNLDYPSGLTVLPDDTIVLRDCAPMGRPPNQLEERIMHITAAGVSLLAGPDPDGLPLDPQHCLGLRSRYAPFGTSMTAQRDGSLVLGSPEGIRLLSPPDALQARLEALVEAGKAAVRAEDLSAYRQAAHNLAFLCAPGSPALGAVNHAAHDQGRLAPGGLAPSLHLIPELTKVVQDQASPDDAERLRAQLALRELRRYKKERLGR